MDQDLERLSPPVGRMSRPARGSADYSWVLEQLLIGLERIVNLKPAASVFKFEHLGRLRKKLSKIHCELLCGRPACLNIGGMRKVTAVFRGGGDLVEARRGW